jgi:hypothetical protein
MTDKNRGRVQEGSGRCPSGLVLAPPSSLGLAKKMWNFHTTCNSINPLKASTSETIIPQVQSFTCTEIAFIWLILFGHKVNKLPQRESHIM